MTTVSRSLGFFARARKRPSVNLRSPFGHVLQGLPPATRSSSDSTSSSCSSSPIESSDWPTPSSKRFYSSFLSVRRHVVGEPLQDKAKRQALRVVQPWEAQLKNKDVSPKLYWRSVRINGISTTTMLPDIINAIASYGPFGNIASAQMLPSRNPATREALVTFTRESGARELARFAATKRFEINGVRPFVRQNMSHPMRQEVNKNFSRVLQIIGDASLPNFDEEGLRNILLLHGDIVKKIYNNPAIYVWGFESMPATYWIRPDGKKVMNWPFYDIEKQAIPFMLALRRYFKKALLITMGRDPCGKEIIRSHYAGQFREPKI